MMRKMPKRYLALALVVIAAFVVAACGGGADPTAVPMPTASPAPPTATPATMEATAIGVPPTPTPVATGNQPAFGEIPPESKVGGTLQLRLIGPFPLASDTFDSRGWIEYSVFGPIMNNLVWKDPYGPDGSYFTGDTAESWEYSDDGKVLTFKLRQGVTYHDGSPFDAEDVVYNLDRAVNPIRPTAGFFKTRMASYESSRAVDSGTVEITLRQASNVFFPVLTMSGFLMYPSHIPLFEETHSQWKKNPIGTGPFQTSSMRVGIKYEVQRYVNYFKPGLPYVDAIVMTNMSSPTATAAFRAGKLDATNLDSSPTQYQLKELAADWGWTGVPINLSINPIYLNQKEPFTNPKVREAIDIALDRQAVVNIWLRGGGSRFAYPVIPEDLGGIWGKPTSEIAKLPGYGTGAEREADLARARELLKEAGVDPSDFKLDIMGGTTYPQYQETVDQSIRDLGFKTTISTLPSGETTARLVAGDFDIYATTMSLFMDDPGDNVAAIAATDGAFNYGKWQNPEIDALLLKQDGTFDFAQRKQLIQSMADIVMDENQTIPVVVRFGYHGYMPWVKNWPPNIQFLHDNIFRYEQIYLDRG